MQRIQQLDPDPDYDDDEDDDDFDDDISDDGLGSLTSDLDCNFDDVISIPESVQSPHVAQVSHMVWLVSRCNFVKFVIR